MIKSISLSLGFTREIFLIEDVQPFSSLGMCDHHFTILWVIGISCAVELSMKKVL